MKPTIIGSLSTAKKAIDESIFSAMLAALEAAFAQSCRRSESRVKWTCRDQDAHEQIRAALALAKGEKA